MNTGHLGAPDAADGCAHSCVLDAEWRNVCDRLALSNAVLSFHLCCRAEPGAACAGSIGGALREGYPSKRTAASSR